MVAVRLSDVAPDDKATRVTYGLLNLTHRDSHETPEPLEPGRRYRVTVQLNDVAQSFPAGHRLRLSVSTSYWPLAWPPPGPVLLSVHPGNSALVLPVRPSREEDRHLRPPGEPEGAAPLAWTRLVPVEERWVVHRDLAEDLSTLEVIKDEGTWRIERTGLHVSRRTEERYSFFDDDFGSVRGETRVDQSLRREEWSVRTVTRTVLTSSSSHFYLQAQLDAYERGKRVYARDWDLAIPRDLV